MNPINDIIKPKDFYDSYLFDYHKNKADLLKTALDNHPDVAIELIQEPKNDEQLKKFKLMLRSELTQNYYQSIEALFNLIFVLDSSNSKTFADDEMLIRLSNYDVKKLYERISTIAKTENGLNFLNKPISKKYKQTIARYIFYYGIDESMEMYDGVIESIEAIKYALKIIANDFCDRHQYNNIKHGLRMTQSYKSLSLADPKTLESKITFDWSEAMTYFERTSNPKETRIVTKPFDSLRDYNMTYLTSNLMSNIIECRRISFYGETSYGKSQLRLVYFTKEMIDESSKANEMNITLTHTITIKN